jgi:hypothetical protein
MPNAEVELPECRVLCIEIATEFASHLAYRMTCIIVTA